MKHYITTVLLVASLVLASCASVNTAHTPPDGSAERNAILQAVHHALARQGRKNLVLNVSYLKDDTMCVLAGTDSKHSGRKRICLE